MASCKIVPDVPPAITLWAPIVLLSAHGSSALALAVDPLPQAGPAPLGRGLLLAMAPAVVAGLLSWAVSRWQARRDIQKIQDQIEAQYTAQRRTRATEVLDTLLFQAELLRTQLEAVQAMLADAAVKGPRLHGWFHEIKEECAKGATKNVAEFSAKCHYHLIFAMTTLYYTSLYFCYANEMYRLIAFAKVEPSAQADLKRRLNDVRSAFARTETAREEEERGLWLPVQDNMGISVRKDGSHMSYSGFCRLFSEATLERADHVFLRALDFYGANPAVSLSEAGCSAIVRALRDLVELRPRLFERP